MVSLSFLIPIATAFLATLLAAPFLLRYCKRAGVLGIDQQKKNKPRIQTSGGIGVALGFFLGMMVFIAANVFITKVPVDLLYILAAVLTIILISFIGFLDDIYVVKTKGVNASGAVEFRRGLHQWLKPVLTLPAAIPLMAVFAGFSVMTLPFIGPVDFGILYPLVLIPIGVVVVSNATNMLAGFNGLEAGMMFFASTSVGLYALSYGRIEGAVVAFTSAAALLAFLLINWYPAKILPGDSLTYFSGGAFVSAIILANIEKFGLIVFFPWVIEVFLKLRGGLKVRSYGDLQKDGTLAAPYEKIYSLTHLVMKLPSMLGWKKGFTERQVTVILVSAEAILCSLALLVIRG